MIVFGVYFRNDRGKNQELFNHISIVPSKRKDYILELTTHDFSEGTIPDALNDIADMWVFGKEIQGHEVYIKVQILPAGAICISFHLSERPMSYPFKTETS